MPATIHAVNTSEIEPTVRAMSLVTRKIPVPMVSPMTIAAAERSVRPRTRPPACDCGESGVDEVMERSEPTIAGKLGQSDSVDRTRNPERLYRRAPRVRHIFSRRQFVGMMQP